MLTRAHLAWLTGSVFAIALFLYLRRDGVPFVLFGREITDINLGEAGALLLAGSTLYVFRKRAFISVAGHLDAWLWSHVYLSLMGLVLIWNHAEGGLTSEEKVASLAMALFFFTAAAGIVTRVLYAVVPRLLSSLPDYDPPGVLEGRLKTLENEVTSFVAVKSETFQALYHTAVMQPAGSASPARQEVERRAEAQLSPVEADDFARALELVRRHQAVRRSLGRRRLYRRLLLGWFRVHVLLSLGAMGVALMHIFDAIVLRQRLN